MMKLPFAVSIPHGGTDIPEEFAPNVVATPECRSEDVDHLTREICGVPEERVHHLISFATSRTFVDLNRPPHSFGEEYPDGVVKRKTHLGKRVFGDFPEDDVVRSVLERLYNPYHEQLKRITSDPAVQLTLDCHSMADRSLPVSPDQLGDKRPPICLGYKAGKTAPEEMMSGLRSIMSEVYELKLEDVVIDKPFNGGYITQTYGSHRTPVIQIEFSRGFYLANQIGHPDPKLSAPEIELWRNRFLETLERLAKLPIFR